jgi:phage terminase large subunit-like protein
LCTSDGDCAAGNPWNWNIPQFIEVDLVKKQLGTTKASGETASRAARRSCSA